MARCLQLYHSISPSLHRPFARIPSTSCSIHPSVPNVVLIFHPKINSVTHISRRKHAHDKERRIAPPPPIPRSKPTTATHLSIIASPSSQFSLSPRRRPSLAPPHLCRNSHPQATNPLPPSHRASIPTSPHHHPQRPHHNASPPLPLDHPPLETRNQKQTPKQCPSSPPPSAPF